MLAAISVMYIVQHVVTEELTYIVKDNTMTSVRYRKYNHILRLQGKFMNGVIKYHPFDLQCNHSYIEF